KIEPSRSSNNNEDNQEVIQEPEKLTNDDIAIEEVHITDHEEGNGLKEVSDTNSESIEIVQDKAASDQEGEQTEIERIQTKKASNPHLETLNIIQHRTRSQSNGKRNKPDNDSSPEKDNTPLKQKK
ncbi:Hypothetical protein FKW44_022554, partial [Caligus rogercresseyi]